MNNFDICALAVLKYFAKHSLWHSEISNISQVKISLAASTFPSGPNQLSFSTVIGETFEQCIQSVNCDDQS